MISSTTDTAGAGNQSHTLMVLPSILGGCCSLATCSDGSIAMTSSCAYAIMSGSHAAHSRPNHAGLSLPPPAVHCNPHQCRLLALQAQSSTLCCPDVPAHLVYNAAQGSSRGTARSVYACSCALSELRCCAPGGAASSSAQPPTLVHTTHSPHSAASRMLMGSPSLMEDCRGQTQQRCQNNGACALADCISMQQGVQQGFFCSRAQDRR